MWLKKINWFSIRLYTNLTIHKHHKRQNFGQKRILNYYPGICLPISSLPSSIEQYHWWHSASSGISIFDSLDIGNILITREDQERDCQHSDMGKNPKVRYIYTEVPYNIVCKSLHRLTLNYILKEKQLPHSQYGGANCKTTGKLLNLQNQNELYR